MRNISILSLISGIIEALTHQTNVECQEMHLATFFSMGAYSGLKMRKIVSKEFFWIKLTGVCLASYATPPKNKVK